METKKVRRWFTGLSILVLFSLVWGVTQWLARQQAQSMLNTRYEESFFEALGNVENVEILLSKALASSSPAEINRYLTELWQQAFTAQARLNALPVGEGSLLRVSQFLNQLGDYSFSLGQRLISGGDIPDEDKNTMKRLREEVNVLGEELVSTADLLAKGRAPWPSVEGSLLTILNPFSKRKSPPDETTPFSRISQQMQDFPTLIYDGPFSDHILNRKPTMDLGEEIDEEKAEEIALHFSPLDERDNFFSEVTGQTENEAPIPAWGVSITQEGQTIPRCYLDVSKKGGHVMWLLNPREVKEMRINLGEAIEAAKQFLEARGYANMEVSYPLVEENRAIIPFVWLEEGVLIYPDQVKVSVAMDNGEILGFEAYQFLLSHHTRDLPEPILTPSEATAYVKSELGVFETRLALIPKPDLNEVLTYEVKAFFGDELYHIYINALTGEEEQILRIVQTGQFGNLAK